MAYSVPELLLVGAAQNLVLQGSNNFEQKDLECRLAAADEDGPQDVEEYDETSTW